MYDSRNIDLQFLPNCIRDIIHSYTQDIVYVFINTVLHEYGDNLNDNIILKIEDTFNIISHHCRYIITDWIPLILMNKIKISININRNDYMYSIISYSYTKRKDSKLYNTLFISCIDMMDLYMDFITNYESDIYKELKYFDKTMISFIENIQLCKYAFDKMLSKDISFDQMNEKLIESIKQ